MVVWYKKSFEILSYKASDDTNKFTPVFDKPYETTAETMVKCEFVNEKFMVFGLQSGPTAGETKLLELVKPFNITSVDTKLAHGLQSYSVHSTVRPGNHNFIAMGLEASVGEYKPEAKKLGSGSTIINLTRADGFSDSHKMIGFHNGSSINIQKAH